MEFTGFDARVAKRRALNYWYMNRETLDLSVAEFFAQCRVRTAGRLTHIIYTPHDRRAA